MKNKKIVFLGTPEFAACVLEGLLEEQYNVIAVVSQPDKPVGRKRILTPTPVKEVALKYDNSKGDIYQYKGDDVMRELVVAYEGCPVPTNNLGYMGAGMLGIFVVIGLIIITTLILNKATAPKDKK